MGLDSGLFIILDVSTKGSLLKNSSERTTSHCHLHAASTCLQLSFHKDACIPFVHSNCLCTLACNISSSADHVTLGKTCYGGTERALLCVTLEGNFSCKHRFEHDWPVAAAKYAVWGVGPLSQGSTAAQPVVLFHAPSNKVCS